MNERIKGTLALPGPTINECTQRRRDKTYPVLRRLEEERGLIVSGRSENVEGRGGERFRVYALSDRGSGLHVKLPPAVTVVEIIGSGGAVVIPKPALENRFSKQF
jgi:hypothetical protein